MNIDSVTHSTFRPSSENSPQNIKKTPAKSYPNTHSSSILEISTSLKALAIERSF